TPSAAPFPYTTLFRSRRSGLAGLLPEPRWTAEVAGAGGRFGTAPRRRRRARRRRCADIVCVRAFGNTRRTRYGLCETRGRLWRRSEEHTSELQVPDHP